MQVIDYQLFIKKLYEQSMYGCGNHGCLIKRPIGMGTNASCRCSKKEIARNLKRIVQLLEDGNNDWEQNEKA